MCLRSFSFPTRWRWRWLVLWAAVCCVSCSGSSSDLQPVQGKVLYKDQPLQDAVVTFHPKGADAVTVVRPIGRTGKDGTFTLTTGQKEGAAAGEYVVTFICPEEVASKDQKGFSIGPPDAKDRLQGAYANRDTSKFVIAIKKGANQLEPFHLK